MNDYVCGLFADARSRVSSVKSFFEKRIKLEEKRAKEAAEFAKRVASVDLGQRALIFDNVWAKWLELERRHQETFAKTRNSLQSVLASYQEQCDTIFSEAKYNACESELASLVKAQAQRQQLLEKVAAKRKPKPQELEVAQEELNVRAATCASYITANAKLLTAFETSRVEALRKLLQGVLQAYHESASEIDTSLKQMASLLESFPYKHSVESAVCGTVPAPDTAAHSLQSERELVNPTQAPNADVQAPPAIQRHDSASEPSISVVDEPLAESSSPATEHKNGKMALDAKVSKDAVPTEQCQDVTKEMPPDEAAESGSEKEESSSAAQAIGPEGAAVSASKETRAAEALPESDTGTIQKKVSVVLLDTALESTDNEDELIKSMNWINQSLPQPKGQRARTKISISTTSSPSPRASAKRITDSHVNAMRDEEIPLQTMESADDSTTGSMGSKAAPQVQTSQLCDTSERNGHATSSPGSNGREFSAEGALELQAVTVKDSSAVVGNSGTSLLEASAISNQSRPSEASKEADVLKGLQLFEHEYKLANASDGAIAGQYEMVNLSDGVADTLVDRAVCLSASPRDDQGNSSVSGSSRLPDVVTLPLATSTPMLSGVVSSPEHSDVLSESILNVGGDQGSVVSAKPAVPEGNSVDTKDGRIWVTGSEEAATASEGADLLSLSASDKVSNRSEENRSKSAVLKEDESLVGSLERPDMLHVDYTVTEVVNALFTGGKATPEKWLAVGQVSFSVSQANADGAVLRRLPEKLEFSVGGEHGSLIPDNWVVNGDIVETVDVSANRYRLDRGALCASIDAPLAVAKYARMDPSALPFLLFLEPTLEGGFLGLTLGVTQERLSLIDTLNFSILYHRELDVSSVEVLPAANSVVHQKAASKITFSFSRVHSLAWSQLPRSTVPKACSDMAFVYLKLALAVQPSAPGPLILMASFSGYPNVLLGPALEFSSTCLRFQPKTVMFQSGKYGLQLP